MKRGATEAVATANKRGRAAGVAAVRAAKQRGAPLINHGAGTMPLDAPAPYNGTRYTLLLDPDGAPAPFTEQAHSGHKTDGRLHFADAPDFCPTLTPSECIRKGIFGGCYFNKRGGKPGIFGPEVAVSHVEFPAAWFEGVPTHLYCSRKYHVPTNCYGVKSGFGQKEWESKGWIHAQDPRGWFQWYCRFFCGRRTHDDARQIQRRMCDDCAATSYTRRHTDTQAPTRRREQAHANTHEVATRTPTYPLTSICAPFMWFVITSLLSAPPRNINVQLHSLPPHLLHW